MNQVLRYTLFLLFAGLAFAFAPATNSPAPDTVATDAVPSAIVDDPSPNDIVGVWKPSEGTSYIKIFKQKGKDMYHGRVVWLKEPNGEDGKPKADPEGKSILNMLNLRNFVFDADDGAWVDGTIYDPKGGSTYYCTIEMKNENKLEVRGSVDPFGLVGRTDTWVRMKGL